MLLLTAGLVPHMKAGIHMPLIQSIFHELDLLRTFPSNTKISTSDLLGTALVNIYYEIFRENPTMERRKDSSFAQNILIYINENYNKKITLKLLSEHFHISPNYVSRVLKKHMGFTYMQLVHEKRLTVAAQLLTHSSLSVTSIANEIGYENVSFFYKKFYQKYHCTPKEYKLKKTL